MSHTEKSHVRKAYELNYSRKVFGAFAEIGAGQEVVRTFFQAGRASSTIAKSMSAYAMDVSNDIYMHNLAGDCPVADKISYTSRYRLMSMLNHEHRLMINRFITKPLAREESRQFAQTEKPKTLAEKRGGVFPCLFSYANTFSTGDVHYGLRDTYNGWMGVRVQSRSGGFHGIEEENGLHVDLLAHVILLEHDRVGQYETIGHMGVNIIEAACRLLSDPRRFDEENLIISLFEGISKWKVRMDVLEVNPSSRLKQWYRTFDPNNRELSLLVVQKSLSYDTLLSSYIPEMPGELCSESNAKTYHSWKDKFATWHSGFGLKPDENIAAWAYPEDGVREPVRFFARRHVSLILGKFQRNDHNKWKICIPKSIEAWSSGIKESLPVLILPIQDFPKIPTNDRIEFIAFDQAYKEWIAEYPRSAVFITRSSDLAWIVESVRRSLGEDRPGGRSRPSFAVVLDHVQWSEQFYFDFASYRASRKVEAEADAMGNTGPELRNDWEQLSINEIDCLQRIERAACNINVIYESSVSKDSIPGLKLNLNEQPIKQIDLYLAHLVNAKIVNFIAQ